MATTPALPPDWKDYPEPEFPDGEAREAYLQALGFIKQSAIHGDTVLGLQEQRLTAVPPEIGQLRALKKLILASNRLTKLPPEIGQLQSLIELEVDLNKLTELPPEIGQLSALTKLNLHSNELSALPPEIGQLSALTELFLHSNRLSALPPEIGKLTGLRQLYLSYNDLSTLPPEIGSLASLKELILHENKLTTLPPEVGQLATLKELSLHDNQLNRLPPQFGQLTGLEVLSLHDNQLSSLPPEIVHLTALTQLHLSNNQLNALPPEIGQLTALTNLSLHDNQINVLPQEIGRLTALKALDLSINQLRALPKQIGRLKALTQLHLSFNQLSSLPPEIAHLTALKELDLRINQLTELPKEIGQLTALTLLRLDSNQLRSLPPEIGQLTALRALHLHRNHLTALPIQIGELRGLMQLRLSENKLREVPPEIGLLASLVVISLRSNQLQTLPKELQNLKKLRALYLQQNEALGLPPDVLGPTWEESGRDYRKSTNPADILSYYFALMAGASKDELEAMAQKIAAARAEPGDKSENEYEPDSDQDMELLPPNATGRVEAAALADQATRNQGMGAGRDLWVAGMAGYLRNSPVPLTVSIEGAWGMGKSTAMMQIRAALDPTPESPWPEWKGWKALSGDPSRKLPGDTSQRVAGVFRWLFGCLRKLPAWLRGRTVRSIWFNPWRCRDAEGLWASFLEQFTVTMKQGCPALSPKRFLLRLGYVRALRGRWFFVGPLFGLILLPVGCTQLWRWIVAWLGKDLGKALHQLAEKGMLEAWGGVLAALTALLGLLKIFWMLLKPARNFQKTMQEYFKDPDYAARIGTSERLHREFRAWLHACVPEGERVYVFIDDLDRCEAPLAAELLESLHLLTQESCGGGEECERRDFPLVIVLGMDREKVAAGVAVKHGRVLQYLDTTPDNGRADAGTGPNGIEFGYQWLQKFIDLPVRLPPMNEDAVAAYVEMLVPKACAGRRARPVVVEGQSDQAGVPEEPWGTKPTGSEEEITTGGPRQAEPPNPGPSSKHAKEEEKKAKRDEALRRSREEAAARDLEDGFVADVLEWALRPGGLLAGSPRLAKHFLNLLRLRWHLCCQWFPSDKDGEISRDSPSLETVARLALLEVIRPVLFRDMLEGRAVMNAVEEAVRNRIGSAKAKSEPFGAVLKPLRESDRRWFLEAGIMVLYEPWSLRGGFINAEGDFILSNMRVALTGTKNEAIEN